MKKTYFIFALLLLAACADPTTVVIDPDNTTTYPDGKMHVKSQANPRPYPPNSAFTNPGDPERYLDSSKEVVTLGLASKGSLGKISKTVMSDRPTRAELNCSRKEALCAEAKSIFDSQNVPVQFKNDSDSVTLIYERVVARDCDSRFIDNSNNPYNQSSPSFGCSVVANTLQMVSDKRQITDPSLMDLSDGEKAVQNYRRYQAPSAKPLGSTSLLKTITTQ